MTFEVFNASLKGATPPEGLTPELSALWYAGKGDWEKAHDLVQDLEREPAYWVHGYLHRQEGNAGNAEYWYRKIGRKMPAGDLSQEWEEIVRALLQAM